MIQFSCAACEKTYRVPDHHAGRRAKCGCGAIIDVPATTALVLGRRRAEARPVTSFKEALQVLGLPARASLKDARESYRRLAKQFHPDGGDSPDSASRFVEIVSAYEYLKEQANARRSAAGNVVVSGEKPVVRHRTADQPMSPQIRPWITVRFDSFVAEAKAAAEETIGFLQAEKDRLSKRICELIAAQMSIYSSADEMEERATD